jgi:hypothetical protein
MDEFLKGDDCAWETVLDLDALSTAEGANWVWKGTETLDQGLLAPQKDSVLDRRVFFVSWQVLEPSAT